MLLSYKECIQLYGNKYQLNKKLQQGEIYKLEKDLYSDQKY